MALNLIAAMEKVFRECPRCKSANVRPSRVSGRRRFVVFYRCRDCKKRFWATSKTVYSVVGIFAVVIVVAAFGLAMWSVGEDRANASAPPAPAVAPFGETIKIAESGNPVAQYELAHMYARGDGVRKNEKEALVWLEQAAWNGNVEAQYEFGLALREGRGTVQDFERALGWLQLAAVAGNAQAQFELGRMFFLGMGGPVDKVKAYIWFNLSAANGVIGAAQLRDSVLGQLSPDQVVVAQAESRRLIQGHVKQPAKAQ